jgi:phosphohistidine phosphatase SixA
MAEARAVVYLVRHADAGCRTHRPDDHLRALSPLGRDQARDVAARLHGTTAGGHIVSSPYVRCVQTVEPLAHEAGRSISIHAALAEGMPVQGVLDLLARVPDGSVLCTHGDLLAAVGAQLCTQERRRRCNDDKGVIWVLHRHGSALSVADVVAPRSSVHAGCA